MTCRGALIVLEGCDKAGKSTHINLLLDRLRNLGKRATALSFPDRSTAIGGMIDKYLKLEAELQDESIHLLFAANRWELRPKIEGLLLSGESVLVDRYAFSGVAFSSAKGLDVNWCMGPEIGLPRPDAVVFLDISNKDAADRNEYGQERYEKLEFQDKVKAQFYALKDDTWNVIESNRSIPEVHNDILQAALNAITECEAGKPIHRLWK